MAWISKSGGLTVAEMNNNANIVIDTFRNLGYNDSSIAGMLANFQNESGINPGRHEEGGGGGYGIIQWTPVDALINHAANMGLSDYQNGDTQLKVIISEVVGSHGNNAWYTSSGFITPYYPSGASADMIGLTGDQFLHNPMGWLPDKLAVMYMVGRERPSYDPNTNHVEKRKRDAISWFEYMGGIPPHPTKPKNNLIMLMVCKALFNGL